MFTLGQLDRINATLDGYRRSLWQYENLIETGVLNYNDIPEQINDSGFELYPNPTNDILNIKSKSVDFDNAQVELYDLSGKLLLNNTLQENTLRIDVSGLASGFYIIKINGKSEKFIKK
ncbi:MAG: T9SS type A sorting domain-containing protein [Bacteroidales bacterium]|nr:T9SS type A sorting domain-containing protein [Bacteroidales bacterium]MBQ7490264.1 T9SS type A sorting domain-containing protein [Bacteroidales bacterium]